MATVRLAGNSDMEKWNEFVLHSSKATIFHRFEWGQVLNKAYGYKIHSLIIESDGQVRGILPLARVRSRLFGDRLISMPFADYGGSVADTEESADILRINAEALTRKLGAEYLEIRVPSRKIIQEGYQKFLSGHSYLVDLTPSEEKIWSGFDSRTRSGIRRAKRRGVKVDEVSDPTKLKEYYVLYKSTMRRHGSPCHPYRFFEELWNVLYPVRLIKILLGRVNERTVAGALFLIHKGTIHYWSGATLDEARSTSASNLIFWNIILQGKKLGCHSLDMGRTRPGTGVDFFKKGWGGRSIELNHLYYTPNQIKIHPPDPLASKYRLMSMVWRKMPFFLTQSIGPRVISAIAL